MFRQVNFSSTVRPYHGNICWSKKHRVRTTQYEHILPFASFFASATVKSLRFFCTTKVASSSNHISSDSKCSYVVKKENWRERGSHTEEATDERNVSVFELQKKKKKHLNRINQLTFYAVNEHFCIGQNIPTGYSWQTAERMWLRNHFHRHRLLLLPLLCLVRSTLQSAMDFSPAILRYCVNFHVMTLHHQSYDVNDFRKDSQSFSYAHENGEKMLSVGKKI